MGKTRKNYRKKGGRVIASGGYGCVFNPGLKCYGSSERDKEKISKLMTTKHATQEYDEITKIKEVLDSIPNYKDYFLIYDASLCHPAKLTVSDLSEYKGKCTALPKNDITKDNINSKLDELMILSIPNGGLPVDDFIYKDGTFDKIYKVHLQLVKLLKNGIIPMNKHNIYHCDIKDSNILIDDSETIWKARLIDWGLSVQYKPNESAIFPRNWRNRPLQFNVPFSVIIFTDEFYNKYTKYLNDGGEIKEAQLKPFVIEYLNFWMKSRGAGHYKFINEIFYMLYSHSLSTMSDVDKAKIIETEFTIPAIVDYIVDVLVHYTKFKNDGKLNLRAYLNEVFIEIVDIWGFITTYYPLLELLSNNYATLSSQEMQIFKQLHNMFDVYLYKPRHEPINMPALFKELKKLGNLLHISAYGSRKSTSYVSNSELTGGISKKVFKMNNNKDKIAKLTIKNKSAMFKRKPLNKRFKKPFFLSIK